MSDIDLGGIGFILFLDLLIRGALVLAGPPLAAYALQWLLAPRFGAMWRQLHVASGLWLLVASTFMAAWTMHP